LEFKKFRAIAEILGIITIVVSLLFVGLQIRQSDQIARAEIDASQGMMSIELAALISDHSEVWARGAAQEELNDADAVVFENLVMAVNHVNYSLFWQVTQNDSEANGMGYLHDFSGFLHRHPGARQVWIEREAKLKKYRITLAPGTMEYNSVYVDTILSDLDKLDRMQP
jgi:hypothetical protein